MNDPKTTVAGYLGLVGAFLVLVGQVFPAKSWAQLLTQVGVLLSGGSTSVGLIAARDGTH